ICQDGGEGARAPAVTDQGQFRDNAWTCPRTPGAQAAVAGGAEDWMLSPVTGHRPARLLP
ncbi:hypothetical protein, partial [Streptomyces murinus]|uniref:hypothetical protein n=1 Tax=Streptomyces murinus TaxID=33900 RepID=UPI001ABF224D